MQSSRQAIRPGGALGGVVVFYPLCFHIFVTRSWIFKTDTYKHHQQLWPKPGVASSMLHTCVKHKEISLCNILPQVTISSALPILVGDAMWYLWTYFLRPSATSKKLPHTYSNSVATTGKWVPRLSLIKFVFPHLSGEGC